MLLVGGQLEVVQFFISQLHCDPMCRGRWDRTPLHNASQEGQVDVVKYLIEEGQADPSCQDENGVHPPSPSCKKGPIPCSQVPDTGEAV